MISVCNVCKACKKSDLIITDGDCGGNNCGPGNSFKDFVAKDHDTKTLLDEFANAAMAAIITKAPYDIAPLYEVEGKISRICDGAYDYAAAMMKERARRDEMGSIKEVTEQ